MNEEGVLKSSHETRVETSIDGINKTSINTHREAESDARAEDSTSIDGRGDPSIDGQFEFGQRAYDSSNNKLFLWERRDEYGVYRDEHGYAQAHEGTIIYVSKEDIIHILERATMHREANIHLPEHA